MSRKPICPHTLKAFYDEGKPLKEIAAFFDCTPATICNRAKALGISHPKAGKNKLATAHKRFEKRRILQRYRDGETISSLKVIGETDHRTLTDYLKTNGVRIRHRDEQNRLSAKKHGTRFHSPEVRLRRAIDKLPEPLGRWFANIYRDGAIPNIRKFAERYDLPFEMVWKVACEIRDCVEKERG